MRYDAVAFLMHLFPGEPHTPCADMCGLGTPSDLPGDWYVEWDERAAVMEFDGGLPRERAEALALQDILRQMGWTSSA